jgi:hypothetical protein
MVLHMAIVMDEDMLFAPSAIKDFWGKSSVALTVLSII